MIRQRIEGEATETPEVIFALRRVANRVRLAVVDSDGRLISNILEIQELGTVVRCGSVSQTIGLDLDDRGAIRIGGM